MSSLTARDKWLAACLPAFVTLLFGWLFFLRPSERSLSNLRQRVENQGPLSARQALVVNTQAMRADLEKAIADKRSAPAEEGGVFDRNSAMQQVSLLCAANGLSLNATSHERGGRLPPALQEATAALTRAPNTAPPQIWRIELSGTYPDMVKLLAGLQKSKPLIVPLSVSMQTGKNERKPATWILTLWL
jgi:hypothetical protein